MRHSRAPAATPLLSWTNQLEALFRRGMLFHSSLEEQMVMPLHHYYYRRATDGSSLAE
jgi:hypothetical protein